MNEGWKLRVYYAAYAATQTGDWIFMFVIPWIVLISTESATEAASVISVLGLMNGVFALIGSLSAPVAMDRVDKRTLMIILNIGLAMISGAIVLFFANSFHLLAILAFVVLKSTFFAMFFPIEGALLAEYFPDTTERENLYRKRGLLMNITRVAVMIFSGYMIAIIGASWLLSIDAISFLLISMVFYFLGEKRPPNFSKRKTLELWSDGIKFIHEKSKWGALLLIFALLNCMGSINFCLTPVLSAKENGWDAIGIGWILGAGGLGGILGTNKLHANWLLKRGILFSICLFCMFSFILPFMPNVTMASVLYFLIVSSSISMSIRIGNTLQGIGQDVRESILSLQSVILNTINPIARFPLVYVFCELAELSTSTLMKSTAVMTLILVLLVYLQNRSGIDELCKQQTDLL